MGANIAGNQQNGFNYYTPGGNSQSPYASFFQQPATSGNNNGFPGNFYQSGQQGRTGMGMGMGGIGGMGMGMGVGAGFQNNAASFAAPQIPGYGAAMPPVNSSSATFPNAFVNENPNVLKRSKKDFFEGTLSVKDSSTTSSKNSLMQSIAPKISGSHKNNSSHSNDENTPLIKSGAAKGKSDNAGIKPTAKENQASSISKNDFIQLATQIRKIINSV